MRILHRCKKTALPCPAPPVFGLLYNNYAVFDARGIAPDGWHVAVLQDWADLRNYAGSTDADRYEALNAPIGGGWWTGTFDVGLNTLKWNAVGCGIRYQAGSFGLFGEESTFWYTSKVAYSWIRAGSGMGTSAGSLESFNSNGRSLRFVKDSTALSNGQCGQMIDNNGNKIPTICINGKEWTAVNMYTTRFRNGDIIPYYYTTPEGLYTAGEWRAWGGLLNPAVCAYNNDISIVAPGFSWPT
jgi:uncharacterized protein (TIGR02145 family)